jgi:hypothetical protein
VEVGYKTPDFLYYPLSGALVTRGRAYGSLMTQLSVGKHKLCLATAWLCIFVVGPWGRSVECGEQYYMVC